MPLASQSNSVAVTLDGDPDVVVVVVVVAWTLTTSMYVTPRTANEGSCAMTCQVIWADAVDMSVWDPALDEVTVVVSDPCTAGTVSL